MKRHSADLHTDLTADLGADVRFDDPGAARAPVGEHFARAFAARDRSRLLALLSETVDIMLRHWLRPDDVLSEVRSLTSGQIADTSGQIADRPRVPYRLAVRRAGKDPVLEQ